MDSVIINLASGHYPKGQERLRQSLVNVGYEGQFLSWTLEDQIGSPLHQNNPYAFKVYAFEEALRQGFRKILWLDASIYAIKPFDPIWEYLDKIGYVKEDAGHLCSSWSSDSQLEYFGITRDEAEKMKMHGNAGFLALDFDRPISQDFFTKWKQSMLDGQFKGPWTNDNNSVSSDPRCKGTRHDMICGSIIANQLEMYDTPDQLLLAYVGPQYGTPPETVVMLARGIV